MKRGCDLLILLFCKQDQKIAAFRSSYMNVVRAKHRTPHRLNGLLPIPAEFIIHRRR